MSQMNRFARVLLGDAISKTPKKGISNVQPTFLETDSHCQISILKRNFLFRRNGLMGFGRPFAIDSIIGSWDWIKFWLWFVLCVCVCVWCVWCVWCVCVVNWLFVDIFFIYFLLHVVHFAKVFSCLHVDLLMTCPNKLISSNWIQSN